MESVELFEKNKRFVWYLVNKLHKTAHNPQYWDMEDITQEAFLALWKACLTYDPEKGAQFSTYAQRCITNQIFMYLRRNKRVPNTVSFDFAAEHDKNDRGNTFHDVIQSSANVEAELLAKDLRHFYQNEKNTTPLYKQNPRMREQHSQMFELMVKGYKQMDIVKEIGLSQSYVARLQQKLKKQIQECWVNG